MVNIMRAFSEVRELVPEYAVYVMIRYNCLHSDWPSKGLNYK